MKRSPLKPCTSALARGESRLVRSPLKRVGRRGKRAATDLVISRRIVEMRDGLECARCGCLPGLHGHDLHHIQSRARGGSNLSENLRLLCRECHDAITFYTVPDWQEWIK